MTIWDLLDPSPTQPAAQLAEPQADKKPFARERFWRVTRTLDIVGLLVWLYIVLKLFFWDPDAALVHLVAPSQPWLVNFRILVFLVGLLVLISVGKKWALIWIPYIVFWPLIWLVWRLPRLLVKKKAWNVVVAFAQVCVNTAVGVIPALYIVTFGIVGCSICWFSTGPFALVGSVIVVLVWATVYFLTLQSALRPARFLELQAILLEKLKKNLKSEPKVPKPLPQRRGGRNAKLSKNESDQFIQNVSFALMFQKTMLLWSTKVNDYRRSKFTFLYGPLSTIALILATAILFGFANLGIYHYDATQYYIDAGFAPSLLNFVYYSFVGLYTGEITGLAPRLSVAVLTKLSMAVIGALLLLVLLAALVQNYRVLHDAEKADKVVKGLQGYVKELEVSFKTQYILTPAEALGRLAQMGSGLVSLIAWMGLQASDSTEDMSRVVPPQPAKPRSRGPRARKPHRRQR